ncbi:MAG: type II toxin-antitoxin system RelE/ParE family toxin [Nitrospira sp.]|nr:type II toxin-antitoxin system RelE/ParE family toxin [Nitrospira sp.]MBP6207232.1 type II toxin-antitoxin system RelE/ParE family toxin [Nitrospira sp.]MBP7360174.1 type II toxin-antitoxin system RelE/ParE family toxin [Nitrospira sp.]MBP8105347.1 type II toxin-antitoxin system RelE/ParE family toxin [Nitrospira sp.]MBP8200576.1 type II toxin-antitoxin system RelE/ParE family toxin [Nitrospira sp.]
MHDIHQFIAQDNPLAATHAVETLYQKTEILREFPESGYRYWQRPDRHIRILLHGHYRIAYVIKDSGAIASSAFSTAHSALIAICCNKPVRPFWFSYAIGRG